MKILEQGCKQTGWATEVRCTGRGNGGGGCNALLLVEHGDLYLTRSAHYDGSREVYITFRCPCGVETDIPNYPGPAVTREKHRSDD